MSQSEILTIAISVGVPLLAFAFTFGRFAQKADGLKESMDKGFEMLAAREERQDQQLEQHHGRLTSLETWREIREGRR